MRRMRPTAAATATAATPATATEPERFLQRLQQSLADGSFVRLTLGRPTGGDATLDKLLARRLLLRGAEHLSLVWRHRSKDITKNLALDEALALLATLIGGSFGHAHLVTRGHDIQLALGKKGQWGLRIGIGLGRCGSGHGFTTPFVGAAYDAALPLRQRDSLY